MTKGVNLDTMFRQSKAKRVAELLLSGQSYTRQELAAEADVSPTTIPRVVNALEETGIAIDRSKDANGRSVIYKVRSLSSDGFGSWLMQRRQMTRLSVKQAAEAAGIPASLWGAIEEAWEALTLDQAVYTRLATALDLPPSVILRAAYQPVPDGIDDQYHAQIAAVWGAAKRKLGASWEEFEKLIRNPDALKMALSERET